MSTRAAVGRLLERLALMMLMLASSSVPAAAQTSPEALLDAMRGGGTVIFLRHAETVQNQIDTGRLGDRAGQRNLSDEGERQAEAIGSAFEKLGIPLSEILASPVFRARDTAEIAFGPERIVVSGDLVADDYAGSGIRTMLAATTRRLVTAPAEGNVLLVGHRTPLAMVTGQAFPDGILPEGGMAVFRPDGSSTPNLLGTLDADAFVAAAQSW